jgi:hypothetical protein
MLVNVQFGAITNREDWPERVEITDEDGTAINLSSATIRLEVRAKGSRSASLSAESGDGVLTGNSSGVIEWRFPADDMEDLSPGTYEVGLIYTLSGRTTQVLTGFLPVHDGILE